ncbi:hypothetical protein AVEN_34499-1 [Araneus ventricosus]|uniref:Uncharacterized protein n=1 Tax=Araneus ventricosus TaxID=182803 RepID=A0A4Y2MRG8_ARAVE|nr:hypothetical protein AVEN_34499-1 [Araneus ventricosus]
MLGSTVFSLWQHYELSDYGLSERGSSKDRLHRFPSILAAPRASPAKSMDNRHGLAPPNPARSYLLFAAKPQSPGREPGGPSSLLQSQSLSPSSEPKTSLSQTADNQNFSHRPQTGEKHHNS